MRPNTSNTVVSCVRREIRGRPLYNPAPFAHFRKMIGFICLYYSLLYLTITTIHGHTLSPYKLNRSPHFYITERSTMDSSSSAPLPNPNRYITDNDANGESFFSTALPPALPVANDLGGALMRLGYIEAQPPALLTNDTDLKAYETPCRTCPHSCRPAAGPRSGASTRPPIRPAPCTGPSAWTLSSSWRARSSSPCLPARSAF